MGDYYETRKKQDTEPEGKGRETAGIILIWFVVLLALAWLHSA